MNRWITEEELNIRPAISRDEAEYALALCRRQVERNVPAFGTGFPGANSENLFYSAGPNRGWTTGFWTGELWLAWESGKEEAAREVLRHVAEQDVESFLSRIERKEDVDHHDMGFLYTPSCVASYRLTGNQSARKAAVLAADQLLTRFQPVGEFLQAWGSMNEPGNYRFIVDCLLNVPLLFWASDTTGDPKYRDTALKHINTAMRYVIREDGSTWHTVFLNPETGAFDHGATCQGYRDGSAWARGQAWAVYGTAMAFRYTGDENCRKHFRTVTSYFLSHLPKDLIPYWDLSFGDGDGYQLTPLIHGNGPFTEEAGRNENGGVFQPRDSSSGLIAACGMLEMSRYLPESEKDLLRTTAGKLVRAVTDSCLVKDSALSNGLSLHGTYSHKSPYNTCTPEGTEECVLFGDYFLMEALTRIVNPDWVVYW